MYSQFASGVAEVQRGRRLYIPTEYFVVRLSYERRSEVRPSSV